jgi:hypothetical protein
LTWIALLRDLAAPLDVHITVRAETLPSLVDEPVQALDHECLRELGALLLADPDGH